MKNRIIVVLIVFSHYSFAQCDVSMSTSFYSGFGVSCFGDCDGTIAATPSGTAPFSYTWATGDTTQSISGLCAGMYALTVTDNAGCTVVDSIEITEPAELLASITILNPISQIGAYDGELASFSSGGVPNYTYDWFNCAIGTNTTMPGTPTSAGPGDWGVMVTDLNGCTDTACVALNWPNGDTCLYISENYDLGGLDCAWGVYQAGFQIDAFQWVNCDSLYAPFPGDTNAFYSSNYGGNVAVIIYAHGCIDTSYCMDVCSYGIDELPQNKRKLLKIVDLMGRERENEPNTLQIFIYDDGTIEKVFRIE